MVGRSSWERRRSWASIASRWSRTGWKHSKLWWQAGHRGLGEGVHEDQQLASLIVEFMGNPAALGLLGLQELAGEALQPLTGGLHFGIKLALARAGGLVRKEPCLLMASSSNTRPDSSPMLSAPITRLSRMSGRASTARTAWPEVGSDGGREGDARISEDVGRDHGLAGMDGQPHHPHPRGIEPMR